MFSDVHVGQHEFHVRIIIGTENPRCRIRANDKNRGNLRFCLYCSDNVRRAASELLGIFPILGVLQRILAIIGILTPEFRFCPDINLLREELQRNENYSARHAPANFYSLRVIVCIVLRTRNFRGGNSATDISFFCRGVILLDSNSICELHVCMLIYPREK